MYVSKYACLNGTSVPLASNNIGQSDIRHGFDYQQDRGDFFLVFAFKFSGSLTEITKTFIERYLSVPISSSKV